jgi:hypothetical protein
MPSTIDTAAGPTRMGSSVRERFAQVALRAGTLPLALLGVAVALGAFLRLQQIHIQWLIDDEWHAINRIQATGDYRALVASFGHADYSIPLALLDRAIAQTVGLTELAMRLPMLACGIATLAIAGAWAWRRLGPGTAVLFTFYLAASSLLVCYSRNARPYAITLLLAGVAIAMLARWRATRSARTGAAYAAATWLAAWLHLTTAPLLIAPLIWVFVDDLVRGLRERDWRDARRSFALGAALAAALAAVILPPLLLDPHALGGKLGQHAIGIDTLIGALHIMAGTGSPVVVVALLALAAVGAPTLWRALRGEMALFAVGLATTIVLLFFLQPMWINHALVLVRYLLPLLPVLLLAAACGVMRIASAIDSPWLRAAVVGVATLGALVGAPHAELLQRPNNFTLHSYHQFDYRKAGNETRQFVERIPTSPYWSTLTRFAPGTLRIAVAGHGFESFHLGDVLWQPIHRQRLFNAQLSGFCMPLLPGEGLREHGVRLANAVTLADRESLERRRIDILVWKKLSAHSAPAYADIAPCEPRMREAFGPPAYEDEWLMAFVLRERAR